ncbi:MAG: metal-dependent transcriptional regulator [Halanaerobiaceae bacterium]
MESTINITSSMEDYLEAILEITRESGSARISEIADKLDLAASSVSEVIGKLAQMQLVTQKKYGPVLLTSKGRDYAEIISCRHQMIKKFLTNVLGVDEVIAENDACMMEHVISNVTMEHLAEFLVQENEILANPDCSRKFN